MTENPAKKQKRGFISEESVSSTLGRYSAPAVLALMHEVAHCAARKIDWKALVKNTATGIKNAREYQMLWRHLAYGDSLVELEEGAEPMDDDSDLDYELEVFPPPNAEASAEAVACVKVLIASNAPSDTSLPNNSTVEAPLIINIPNGSSVGASSENPAKGINIIIPVSVQKQSAPSTTFTEGVDANGASSMAARRKRKLWSEEEDKMLLANVEKHGEGNWATIVKGEFKGDRTASQLSQRWAILKKKRGILNVATSQSQRTEMQLATNRALSVALPVKRPTPVILKPVGTTLNNTPGNPVRPPTDQSPLVRNSFPQAQHQHQNNFLPRVTPSSVGPLAAAAARVTSKKTLLKCNLSSDSTPSSAAAAAAAAKVTDGIRVATSSSSSGPAPTLLNAASKENNNNISRPPSVAAVGSLIKPPVSSNTPNTPVNIKAPYIAPTNRPGLTSVAVIKTPSVLQSGLAKSEPLKVQQAVNAVIPGAKNDLSSKPDVKRAPQVNPVNCGPRKEQLPLSKPETKLVNEVKVSNSDNIPKEVVVVEDGKSVKTNEPSLEAREQKAIALPIAKTELGKQAASASDDPNSSSSLKVTKNDDANISAGNQIADDSKIIGKAIDPPSVNGEETKSGKSENGAETKEEDSLMVERL